MSSVATSPAALPLPLTLLAALPRDLGWLSAELSSGLLFGLKFKPPGAA